MSNSFLSWHELFVSLEAKKYKIYKVLKKSVIELQNDALLPIIQQNISADSITLTYLGSIQSSKLWQTLPKTRTLVQALDISTHLPIITNPIITIKNFQTTNPSFYVTISHLSQQEATTLLNSFPSIPNFVKDFFSNQNSIELQLGNDFINFKLLGEIDIREMLNNFCLGLGLKKIDASFGALNIWNPSVKIHGFGTQHPSYQVTIPQVNPEYIINLFKNLGEITLPDFIQIKLDSLDNVSLILFDSGIYLEFTNDLYLNLGEIFSFDSAVPYMDIALNKIINEIFGKPELVLSKSKFGFFRNLEGVEISLKGLLNAQNFELKLGNRKTLFYQVPNDIDFGRLTNTIPIINELKLINPELIITNVGYSAIHSKLGRINLNKGFNFIGDIDVTHLDTNFGSFIHSKLEIGCLGVHISFDPTGLVSLTSNIQGEVLLFSIEKFSATFTNLLIKLDIGVDLEPNFGLTGNLLLQGYDPTQNAEPPLFLSGAISLEPESLTAFFCQQGENSWCNPYGLVGTELRHIGFQGGGTYLPPYFDNFGFIGDLKWEKIDLEVAFLMDTNDPEKLALVLTTNQAVSLVDLWQGPVAAFVSRQVNFQTDLVNKALRFLDKFLDLNIESIDRDEDEKLEPLIKFVPFPTTIAGQPISEGLQINGKITAWGNEAILIIQSDTIFSNIEGSLKVSEIDLGFIQIGGTDDDSLDLALKVTPSEQYLIGDGYVEIFDNQIANIEFQITPTNAIFQNFDLNLVNLLSIDVDALSIDLKSGSGSGYGTISVLGNTLAGITFDVTSNSVILKNTKLSLAGFLTVEVSSLTVNLANKVAMGQANITAFNQSLGSGTLSFNTQNVAIERASLNLGNILKFNVPKLNLDLTNKKFFGLGDVTVLGKEFTSLGISLNETGFQSTSNFNFGILAFNGATVSLGKAANGNINNSASLAGNLKFLGHNFANITASINSSKLTVSGSFDVGGILTLKGVKNQKNATITLNKAKNGIYTSACIAGSFYLWGQELTAISFSNNSGILKILGIRVIRKPARKTKISQ